MGIIRLNISAVLSQSHDIASARNTVRDVQSRIDSLSHQIDHKIQARSNIASRIKRTSAQLVDIQCKIDKIQKTIETGVNSYYAAEIKACQNAAEIANNLQTTKVASSPRTSPDSIAKSTSAFKAYAIPTILNLVSPGAGLVYLTSGIPFGNTPSFFDHSRTPSSDADADWLGYEFSEDNPGVTAWVGKANAQAQNEWGYAGVNAYLGKAHADVKADAGFMKTTRKKEYVNGKWKEDETTDFVTAEASAGAGVSVLAADAEAGVGSDMLGIGAKAEGSAGNAKAEVKGEFCVGEDGIDMKVGGEAMVSAVEGKVSGTINILGLEITGKAGGYAGALGVEGKIGIEDNKFVCEGGAAALLGGSVGVEIGFNETGWDNFVDSVTFWD